MKSTILLIPLLSIATVLCVLPFQEWKSPLDPDRYNEGDVDPLEIFEMGKKVITEKHHSKLRLKPTDLYLPQDVYPISYKLKLRPILESLDPDELHKAPGSVEIIIRCARETNAIVLHAQTREYIKISEGSLKVAAIEHNVSGARQLRDISVIGHSSDDREDSDFYKIDLVHSLKPGEDYVVYMEFVTKISTTTLDGLYLSTYTDPNTHEEKYVAVTQFEDIAARQMFPCFDEPKLKSTFELIISRSAKYNSMSNMPLDHTEEDPGNEGYFLDHYLPTPKMSSYLVALVISEFSCTTAPRSLYNKTVQVCGPTEMIDHYGGFHAAEASAKILNYYEKLWLQPYPLPKMQSVAIPDFAAGAMENYGLNTYRVAGLIYYPGVSSEGSRYRIESTIAHELAHQNFGNLVTCKTWNQIFLNEGFATFVSYFGVEEISPEFQSQESGWYTGYYQPALKSDANPNIHPLVKPGDYFGDFDGISYSKGASLIKMMENIISRGTLIDGLRTYLATFAFGNTEYQNLYETLDTEAHAKSTHPGLASMTQIMETWTVQSGFPLIRVQWVLNRMFHISQERFLRAPIRSESPNNLTLRNAETDTKQNSLWYCPIFISTSADSVELLEKYQKPKLWLTNTSSTMAWTVKMSVDWIIVNVNSKAFTRVLYDEKLSEAIETQLDKNWRVFAPLTRAQLIDDAFECAWARYAGIKVGLGRTKFVLEETDPAVWSTLLNHFRQIYYMLCHDSNSIRDFKTYLKPRISNALNAVGVEQKPDDVGKLVFHRSSLISWGILLELPSVLDYAQSLIKEWRQASDMITIPIDIRGDILCAAVIKGGQETVDFFYEQYKLCKDYYEKQQLISAMGCSVDEGVLQRLLENATSPDFVDSRNDAYILLNKLASNVISQTSTYWHLRNNFQQIYEYFESAETIASILNTFSRIWNAEAKLNLMNEFVNEFSNQLNPAMGSVNKTVSRIKDNIVWMEVHGNDATTWFLEQNQKQNLY